MDPTYTPGKPYHGKTADPRMNRKGDVPGTDGAAKGTPNNPASAAARDNANRGAGLSNTAPSYQVGEKKATVSETYAVDGDSNFGTRTSRTITPHQKRGVPSA